MSKRDTDQAHLDAVLTIIRERLPLAHHVLLETSDQSHYGFVLVAIAYDNDVAIPLDIALPDHVVDQINDMLSDIDWDGVVGEDKHGYARVLL